jgi:RNAse (barnase) inhibitor barstar
LQKLESGDRLPTTVREYKLSGANITSLESFYDEISRVLVPNVEWGENLDAFDDILHGGFGTPNEGFVLRWTHSETSRLALGYPETVRQLESKLERCHHTNRVAVRAQLERAMHNEGPTIFDYLVEIIGEHDAGGGQSEDNVRLILD